ncbi:RNA recognition motif 2-domain-containing protein [Madurella fahalii]|uniref:RNA recognition motif 2-domain-containing protein n=1 Tax=Madurella fahalii TaxID=1157608 RepID=A0ABQ0GQS6_9PEZI
MAQAREPTFNPSSPHSSSGGADSYKHEGTPDTRLTAFSPDGNSARTNKLLATLSLSGPVDHPVGFHVTPVDGFGAVSANAEKDPFISSKAIPKPEQKLSPTASSFRPVSVSLVAHGSLGNFSGWNIGPAASQQFFSQYATAQFSAELAISRHLVIYASTRPIPFADVEEYLTKLEQLGSPCQGKRNMFVNDGKVYLRLSNIRDARHIHDNIQLGSPGWRSEYISALEFCQVYYNSAGQTEPMSDGMVQITAFGQGVDFDAARLETVIQTFLETQGDIFAFQRQSAVNECVFRAVVEFSDADVAVCVVQRFHGATLGGVHIILTLCQLNATATAHEPLQGLDLSRGSVQGMTNTLQDMNVIKTSQTQPANALVATGRFGQTPAGLHVPQQQQQMAVYPVVYHDFQPAGPARFMLDHTPTRSQGLSHINPLTPISGGLPIMTPMYTPPTAPMAPMAMHGNFAGPRTFQSYGRLDNRRQHAMRVSRSPYYNTANHHNHVDVNRIRDGIDVRTTIMLRNIPNKVDQAMLKRIVDESSWGKYDFMYLRIDFANDCNVGYAFINFVDPLDIIDFVNARGNQRWNCFKSDKVAEISYATIQGKDCLVQKFRNSSVMLEAPHYRPKLYFTSNGPRPELAGQEEPFPEPDNQSKMKRSCENAEHVGLFTPNAGQHFRDEQRRRRSQYDRGTRLAALEEYDYDAHVQHPCLFSPQ